MKFSSFSKRASFVKLHKFHACCNFYNAFEMDQLVGLSHSLSFIWKVHAYFFSDFSKSYAAHEY